GSSGAGGGAGASVTARGASAGGGISPIDQTSDLRTSTRDTGWIGLQPWAIVFARSPLMTPLTNSPIDCFAATSATSYAMIVRMTRCFEVWMRRSVMAIGFTRTFQWSFVTTSTVRSVRVRL